MENKLLFHARVQTVLMLIMILIFLVLAFNICSVIGNANTVLNDLHNFVTSIDTESINDTVSNSSEITDGISSFLDLFE